MQVSVFHLNLANDRLGEVSVNRQAAVGQYGCCFDGLFLTVAP